MRPVVFAQAGGEKLAKPGVKSHDGVWFGVA